MAFSFGKRHFYLLDKNLYTVYIFSYLEFGYIQNFGIFVIK